MSGYCNNILTFVLTIYVVAFEAGCGCNGFCDFFFGGGGGGWQWVVSSCLIFFLTAGGGGWWQWVGGKEERCSKSGWREEKEMEKDERTRKKNKESIFK